MISALLAVWVLAPHGVRLMAVGDVMLGRGVAARLSREGKWQALAGVRSLFADADLRFANLEGPITKHSATAPSKFRLPAPPAAVAALEFDVVSLANNHAMDCGPKGLQETLDHLNDAGIVGIGAGPRKVAFIERKGVTIAFLAFSEHIRPDERGFVVPLTIAEVQRSVRAARPRADVVVVSAHWGDDTSPFASVRQRALAQACAREGVDLVVGHGPHVWQPIAAIRSSRAGRRTWVAYSLGNFIFDNDAPAQAATGILVCDLDRSGVRSLAVRPVRIRKGLPELPRAEERRAFLSELAERCRGEGVRASFSSGNLIVRKP